MDCIFCDIIYKKAKAEVLFENESVISFLDIRPVNYGHALVIPKNHYIDFLSIPQIELNEIIAVTQKVSSAIYNSIKPDGLNVITNNGQAAGQSVFHFHFHIIPRFYKDSFTFKPILKDYEKDSIKEFAEIIRSEIKLERVK